MINYNIQLVSALKSILPTHYELALTSQTKTPCISYMETNNSNTAMGDTLGYSRLQYMIKVWGTDIGQLIDYAEQIDKLLRPLGFNRTSSNELFDPNSSMIQKILTYECQALEEY